MKKITYKTIKESARASVQKAVRYLAYGLLPVASLFMGCYDDGVSGDNYYTYEGQTIGDFLEADEQYSQFTRILERAGMMGLMIAYGEYTCLAPDNAAVEQYIDTYFPGSTLEELPDSALVAVAKSHLIGRTYLTSDLLTGYLSTANMYDRKIQVSVEYEYNAELEDSMTVYLFNSSSKIIQANDTVSNGVVHTINKVLEQSSYVLPDYMSSKSEELGFTLFMEAMKLTQLTDSLLREADESEEMAYKLDQFAMKYTGDGQKSPALRKFGYTVLVEKDEVFKTVKDPLNPSKFIFEGVDLSADLASLINYAKSIYDVVYPEDKDQYDKDYTHPKNPLNRFIAYHILKRNVSYSGLVITPLDWSVSIGGDYLEYYETMCENTLLRLQMVSSKGNGIYLNRCERAANLMEGVEVLSSGGFLTVNGNFQFLNSVLTYNDNVVNMFKTERIRIDTSSLLPELTNNDVRQDDDENMLGWYFPTGYFEDLFYDDNTECFYNRWPQPKSAGHGSHKDVICNQLDNLNFGGDYDVTIRIPAVPAGQYEIRLGYVCNGLMSISQIYFGYERRNMVPVGVPLDMNLIGWNAKVGMVLDRALFDDINNDPSGNTSGNVTITENDKAMRNLGYMKGPAAMWRVENDRVTKKWQAVDDAYYLRRIVTTQQLDNKPFYLRFRKVDERVGRLLNLDFIEICPRNVYNGAKPEDRN